MLLMIRKVIGWYVDDYGPALWRMLFFILAAGIVLFPSLFFYFLLSLSFLIYCSTLFVVFIVSLSLIAL
jgi:hypothetical protein